MAGLENYKITKYYVKKVGVALYPTIHCQSKSVPSRFYFGISENNTCLKERSVKRLNHWYECIHS